MNLRKYNIRDHVFQPYYKYVYYKTVQIVKKTIQTPWTIGPSYTKKIVNNKKKSGYKTLERLLNLLDNLKDARGNIVQRSEIQKKFHMAIIKAILPKIFEKEWNSEYAAILEMFDVVLLKIGVAFSCPRRFGKTWAIAMLVCALMLVMQDFETCLFATGSRMSSRMQILMIWFLLNTDPDIVQYITTQNKEDLIIKVGLSTNITRSLPSSSDVCII